MFLITLFFKKKIRKRGFTLVELLVSVSIFSVITSIVLTSNNRFNSTIDLVNLAQDVALSIRKAQTFGLNSRANAGVFENENGVVGYGVRLRTDTPTQYLFFVDLNASNTANTGEVLEWFTVQGGNTVSKICVNIIQSGSVSLGEHCSDEKTRIALNITYRRPNPEAVMRTNLGYADRGTITVRSRNGIEREIVVTTSGQISVLLP
jgi:prepilin-type N-terminal cleavage/methylation domain-containing protein